MFFILLCQRFPNLVFFLLSPTLSLLRPAQESSSSAGCLSLWLIYWTPTAGRATSLLGFTVLSRGWGMSTAPSTLLSTPPSTSSSGGPSSRSSAAEHALSVGIPRVHFCTMWVFNGTGADQGQGRWLFGNFTAAALEREKTPTIEEFTSNASNTPTLALLRGVWI